MTWSDEQLSAFLDGELNDAETSAIRDALAEDETLADRLAELAEVDAVIRDTYNAINREPLPAAVISLLAEDRSPQNGAKSGKVMPFPALKRRLGGTGRRAAIAASLALAAGLVIGQLTTRTPSGSWQEIAGVLESTASGAETKIAGQLSVKPRLTFRNRNGDYCRLFEVSEESGQRESLACRENGQWQLAATVHLQPGDGSLYRPASGGSPLDGLLDRTLADGPYDRRRESALIDNSWVDH